MSDLFGDQPATPRLCREENTRGCDRPARSIRWVVGGGMFSPEWSRAHYTEGLGLSTACGLEVPTMRESGSVRKEEGALSQVDCVRCSTPMKNAGLI